MLLARQLAAQRLLTTAFTPIISRRLSSAEIFKLDKDEKSVMVNWRKGKDSWSKFHFDWLRDNCPCTDCKHPEYGQRLLSTLEDPTPANVDIESSSEAVKVEWRDGHHSQYPYNWLLANSYCHNNITKPTGDKRKITLWDSTSPVTINPPELNYNDIMTDDKMLLMALRNLYQYGFCFILDTPPTKEALFKAASRVGPILTVGYYGDLWYLTVGSSVELELVQVINVLHALIAQRIGRENVDEEQFEIQIKF